MLKHAWKFLVAGMAVALAACGDGGGGGPSFADSVSTADAEDMADGAAGYAEQMVSQMNFGEPNLTTAAMTARLRPLLAALPHPLPAIHGAPMTLLERGGGIQAALQAAASEGCTITAHGGFIGPVVDVNQNGIPDDMYFKIDCHLTDSTSSDTTWVTTQVQEMSIKERMGDLWGFDTSFLIGQGSEDEFGNYTRIEQRVTEHLSVRAGGVDHREHAAIKMASKQDTVSSAFEAGDSWDGSFDPDDAVALGEPLPDGALSFTGRTYVTDGAEEDPDLSFSLSTPVALQYDAACAAVPTDPPFTAGEILGRLNGNGGSASFNVTFTSCGNFDVGVEGAYDEPIPAVATRSVARR